MAVKRDIHLQITTNDRVLGEQCFMDIYNVLMTRQYLDMLLP